MISKKGTKIDIVRIEVENNEGLSLQTTRDSPVFNWKVEIT